MIDAQDAGQPAHLIPYSQVVRQLCEADKLFEGMALLHASAKQQLVPSPSW